MTDEHNKNDNGDVEGKSTPPSHAQIFINRILGAFALAVSLVIYYTTTCPVIYYGDAGELIVAAWRWGVAHPPGYPSYIIPLGIFLRLPLSWLAPDTEFVQPIAWQANFFSAVIGALTVWIVYLIILRIIRLPWIAFAGSLLVAVGRTFWSQTGIAEVYTLNAFLLALMVLMALVQCGKPVASKGRLIFLRWGSVIWGLALSNHHEAAFFFPLWIVMVYLAMLPDPETRRPYLPQGRIFAEGLLFAGIGLLPYLYLPIAASSKPVLNWGDPSGIRNFFRVLTRADYRHVKETISGNLVTSLDILLHYLWWSFIQYSPIFLLFAIPGFGILFKRSQHRLVLAATAISIFLMSAVFIVYFAGIDRPSMFFLEVYFIPWYIALGILIAAGIPVIVSFLKRINASKAHGIIAVTVILILLGAFFSYSRNIKTADMSDNIAGYVYSHDVLTTLPSEPEKNVLITGGDEIFLFWYWKWVEGIDRDVVVIGMDALEAVNSWFWDDLYRDEPNLAVPRDAGLDLRYSGIDLRVKTLETIIHENRGAFRFWMTAWDPSLNPIIHEGPWHMVLDGPAIELEYDTGNNMADYPRAGASEEDYLFQELLLVNRDGLAPFEEEIYDRYAAACYNFAIYFTRAGQPERAIEFCRLCLRFRPGYSPGERLQSPMALLVDNLYETGDLDLAHSVLEELLLQDPENSLYHAKLAEIYLAEDDIPSAIRELETALSLDPENEWLRALYLELLDSGSSENGE